MISTRREWHTTSELSTIASLVSARDVFNKFIDTYNANRRVCDVWEDWLEKADRANENQLDLMALVVINDKPIGILTHDTIETNKQTIIECMDKIEINRLITIDTPLMDIVKKFTYSDLYYLIVIDNSNVVGWLSYQDLFKLPFRLSLFVQMLSIESKMIEIIQRNSEKFFKFLTLGRQEKALSLFRIKQQNAKIREPTCKNLITCTCLIDKFEMLRQDVDLINKIPSLKKKKMYKKFEILRNALAHPNPGNLFHLLLQREEFGDFIEWILNFDDELVNIQYSGEEVYNASQ